MKYLNKEEKEILESYERGEWKSVINFEKRKVEYIQAAKNTSTKKERINIRST